MLYCLRFYVTIVFYCFRKKQDQVYLDDKLDDLKLTSVLVSKDTQKNCLDNLDCPH